MSKASGEANGRRDPHSSPVAGSPTTVVIAHASRMVVDGLAALLADVTGIEVHATSDELPRFPVDEQVPDVLLLDPALLPEGEEGTRVLRPERGPKVLLIADASDASRNIRLLASGAAGLVDRTAGADSVVHAVQAVARGLGVAPTRYLTIGAERLATAFDRNLEELDDDDAALWLDVADGADYATIAERHFVSERTARRRVDALLKRLGVENRVQAAELAGRVLLRERDLSGD